MGGMVRMGGIAAAPPPERVADRGVTPLAKGERQPHTLTPSNQDSPPPAPSAPLCPCAPTTDILLFACIHRRASDLNSPR